MDDDSDLNDVRPAGRSWLWKTLRFLAVGLLLFLLVGGVVYWLATQKPDFYRASLEMSEEEAFKAGESFEVAGLYLRNDVVEEEAWYAEFFHDHINGWLISDLPRKFKRAIPDNMRDPRVSFEPEKFRLGATTDIRGVETVLSAAIEFFPTEVMNEFGLRVTNAYAGQMPIPVSFFTIPATELLKKYRIQVRWYDDENGRPVAVISVPKNLLSHGGKLVVLEQLEFVDGSVRLAGRTELVQQQNGAGADAAETDRPSDSTETATTLNERGTKVLPTNATEDSKPKSVLRNE
jgi:hypothetical protein